jgi:hypothetical protein
MMCKAVELMTHATSFSYSNVYFTQKEGFMFAGKRTEGFIPFPPKIGQIGSVLCITSLNEASCITMTSCEGFIQDMDMLWDIYTRQLFEKVYPEQAHRYS